MWPSGKGKHLPASKPYPLLSAWETATEDLNKIPTLRKLVLFQIADWAAQWNVIQWDVINEPSDGNCMTNVLGDTCVADWFSTAASNQVNPEAKLFINDYHMITGDRSIKHIARKPERIKRLIEQLQEQNAPLSGLGLQSHFGTFYVPPEEIYRRLNEFSPYGLELAATEFNFDNNLPIEEMTQRTAEIMITYFSHPAVSQFLCWTFAREDATALIDISTGRPTLPGLVWYYLTRILWNTETQQQTDAEGTLSLRTFKGSYDITFPTLNNSGPTVVQLTTNQTFTVIVP